MIICLFERESQIMYWKKGVIMGSGTRGMLGIILMACSSLSCNIKSGADEMRYIEKNVERTAVDNLLAMHGEDQRSRIERGIEQAARLWQKTDGSPESFIAFCERQFISDPQRIEETFIRFEKNLESIYGHFHEMTRDLREPMDLDVGPMQFIDYLFLDYAPDAHALEDYFKTKIAFTALLNFPITTLKEKLERGGEWTRQSWAQTRLAEIFAARVPPEVNQARNRAYTEAHQYVNGLNVYMHHALTEDGRRLFPEGMKLLSHWNLRDELKSQYSNPDGTERQALIQAIMEAIILQTIPKVVIDNSAVDWNVMKNEVTRSPVREGALSEEEAVDGDPEKDRRYAHILEIFKAERMLDPYYPGMPTLMDRRFNRDREIPESKVEALFTDLLSSPMIERIGKMIEERVGRPLLPFDIWYNGFKPKTTVPEAELDRVVSRAYPTPAAFENALPGILIKLGFSRDQAAFLSSKIAVDPARGSGHAMGAERRADMAHLRTRFTSDGMNYKAYNIAIHEFGHNCEQVLSLNRVDHYMLRGVPNNAFTEAFAFVFQARDQQLLGLSHRDPLEEELLSVHTLWSTYEIAGVALVEMRMWRWLYENPGAKPSELKEAVIRIAKEIWNAYYAPVFGTEDVILLAIYSHMIDYGLYLPDYPLGHIIAFQVERYLEGKNVGSEMERMCTLGRLTPDAWMEAAVGEPISVLPLLQAAEEAINRIVETGIKRELRIKN